MPVTHPFRFGLGKIEIPSPDLWQKKVIEAESQGFDIVLVPDHLGRTAPFPALVSAAAVSDLRIGTFVLNSGFYNSHLLARDVATTDQLSNGRFELGLGTGYVHEEFAALGLDPGSPKDRVDALERTLTELHAIFDDPDSLPRPAQDHVPLLVAGNGDRVLRIAAQHADIVGFIGMRYDPTAFGGLRPITHDQFAERIAYFDDVAGARNNSIERNLLIQTVVQTTDREAAFDHISQTQLPIPREELENSPLFLIGETSDIVDQIHRLREDYGISYITVMDICQDAFVPVLERLGGL
ncbi:hypothetical protein GOEFS_036_00010 [Gordonia effusa NBRC 100432]|uniref:Luciferase-like domain-containing protein n=1 Tax=Gordonia effusa NBRC 100432 TaxID=1077974 RepID=H0QXL2_9ACTN|nr:TIGR03621 family F420-dependent LLM class oxidoreductase [Gordonia effusa]GAB17563.1 hypothetical protein GOEFS_036_00010 [Gordonia effusa NBRC 100432]